MIQEEIEAGIETETGIVTGDETDQGQETGNEEAEVAIEDAIEAEIGEGAAAETEREARDRAAVVAIEKGDGKKREKREAGGDGEGFRIKEEPADTGYNDQYGNNYDDYGVNVKQEKMEEENGDEQEAEY